MPRDPSSRSHFRPDVEGLRGLSILLVVLFHAHVPGIHGGFVGVDVFFVLSGYLITRLLAAESAATGRVDFVQFYARRGRRLLPAASLAIIVTLLAGWLVYAPLEQHELTSSARWASLYLGNVHFALETVDYHAADSALNPFLHTWSLAVEEQFYLVWPLLVALLLRGWRGAAARDAAREDDDALVAPPRFVVVVAIVTLLSLACSAWLTRVAQPWAFFGLPTRMWEFGIGALTVLRPARLRLRSSRAAFGLAVAGLAALAVSVARFDASTTFPGLAALLPVLGVVAVLAAGEGTLSHPVTRWLSTPVMQWFGRYSYSWYLWHWPALVVGAAAFGPLGIGGRLALAGGALLLSVVTYRLLENPVRHSRALMRRPRLSVAMGLALAVAVAGLAQGLQLAARRASLHGAQRRFALARDDGPALDGAKCVLGVYAVRSEHACLFGDAASDTTVVLFGDSHAAQWFPALDRIARDRHWRLTVFVKNACTPADVPIYHKQLRRVFHECADWRRAVLDSVAVLRPAWVVVASSIGYARGGDDEAESIPRPTTGEWGDGLRRVLAGFDRAGSRTVLLVDTPHPGFNADVCLARAAWSPWRHDDCRYARDASIRQDMRAAVLAAARGIPSVRVADLTDAICPAPRCAVEQGGDVVFRDTDHLTARFSASLAPRLATYFTPALSVASAER